MGKSGTEAGSVRYPLFPCSGRSQPAPAAQFRPCGKANSPPAAGGRDGRDVSGRRGVLDAEQGTEAPLIEAADDLVGPLPRRSIPASEPVSYRCQRPVRVVRVLRASWAPPLRPGVAQSATFANTTPAQNAANPPGSRLLTPATSEFATAGFLSNHSHDTTDPHAAHARPSLTAANALSSPAFGTRQRRG